MKTMKIKLNKTITEVVEVEMNLPYYGLSKGYINKYICVIAEDSYIEIQPALFSGQASFIFQGTGSASTLERDTFEPITDSEFMAMYNQAINHFNNIVANGK